MKKRHASHAPEPAPQRSTFFTPLASGIERFLMDQKTFSGSDEGEGVLTITLKQQANVRIRLGHDGPMCEVRHQEQQRSGFWKVYVAVPVREGLRWAKRQIAMK